MRHSRPPSSLRAPLALALAAALAGCASTDGGVRRDGASSAPPTPAAPMPAATLSPAEARAAILAMAGDFEVEFRFRETVAIAPGYEATPAKDSGADERVIVVEDAPGRILLQHVLVVGGGAVVKHWRQDWTYEADGRFEYGGEQAWAWRALAPEETRGRWTQCVYEVSDAPRYCGTGAWERRDGVPTWTSDATWRPLPRREYSVRADYQAMRATNRHTIVPGGWTHEQDNAKVVREDGIERAVIAREWGFNDYRRAEGPEAADLSAAGRYWDATAAYWAGVRARWDARLRAGGLRIDAGPDGGAITTGLYGAGERIARGEAVDPAEVDALFDAHVGPLVPAATAAR